MKKYTISIATVFLVLFMNFTINKAEEKRVNISVTQLDEQNYKLNLQFNLANNETIYSNSINISTDNPNILLSNWLLSNNDIASSKELNENFNITLNATKLDNKNNNTNNLFISYLLQNKNEANEEILKLNLNSQQTKTQSDNAQIKQNIQKEKITTDTKPTTKEDQKKSIWNYLYNSSILIQDSIKNSTSIWVQLFFVFILGFLMSLTPCIYPVIPITAGILQMQGSKSVFYNFFISLSYALGMATTFAILGLTAALGGHLFGQILTQPLFVLFISGFLIYLSFSMFGFYDMYVPKFMNVSNNLKHKGSPISAFIFGAISGTIASPCLSPGLALLLTIVAALANKFLGFLLLFSFGIGLSIPLILVGTFSSSINLLPQAGMWMVEVKKIFGFLLLGVSFYYLKNILPFYIILLLIAITLVVSGIWYFYSIQSYDSNLLRIYKNIIGTLLIASSVLIFIKAYQNIMFKNEEILIDDTKWLKNYDDAVLQANKLNKNIIIDIGAPFCTLCKAIDKHVFNNPEIAKSLENFVLLKIDATDAKSEPYASIKEKYKVIGIPTILIINPKTTDLLKRFEGELYDMPKQEVINQLQSVS